MSHDGLKSLLDDLLSDPEHAFAAAKSAADEAPLALPANRFTDVEQLRALADAELIQVLSLATRDDLLTVLSGASDGLRRRILTSLSSASVQWFKQNLAYFDEPTRALLESGRRKLLTLANKLLEGGAIALPRPAATEPADAALDEVERVGSAVVELLALRQRSGRGALGDVALANDPMLSEGVAMVMRGDDEATITAALDATHARLVAAYARRLAVAREGVLALYRGEEPEAFRKRIGSLGG